MSYSLRSSVHIKEGNTAWLFLNGNQLDETEHNTYSNSGTVSSTGGRVVTLEASAGDTIEIRATQMDRYYVNIYFCAEFIPKM